MDWSHPQISHSPKPNTSSRKAERADKQTNSHGRRRTVKAEVSNSRSLGSVSAAAKIRPPGQMLQQQARDSSISRRATSSTPPPPPLLLLLAIPHSNAPPPSLTGREEESAFWAGTGRSSSLVYSAPRNPTGLPLFFTDHAAAFQDG